MISDRPFLSLIRILLPLAFVAMALRASAVDQVGSALLLCALAAVVVVGVRP